MALIHVVDEHPFVRAVLVELLEADGHEVRGFEDAEGMLAAFLQRAPELLLTAHALSGLSGPALVRRLRESGVTRMAVIMLSEHAGSGPVEGQVEGLDVDRVLGRPPPSVLALPKLVHEVLTARAPGAAAPERSEPGVDLQAFELLSALWRRRRSGVIRETGTGQVLATLHRGDPRSPQGLSRLQRALRDGGVTFSPGPEQGTAPVFNLGPALLAAARRTPAPLALREHLDQLLVGRAGERRVVSLPLSRSLDRLLQRTRGPDTTLGRLLRMEQVGVEEVEEELGALVQMGLFRLRPVVGTQAAAPRAPRPQPGPAPQARAPRSESAQRARVATVARHIRETAERLQTLNDWEVIGIPEGSERSMILRAARRQVGRYQALVDEEALEAAERALAQQILDRVREAANRLLEGHTEGSTPAMQLADAALAREEYAKAARHLAVARADDPMNALVLGKLGWALYMCKGQSAAVRERGREQLELALSMDASEGELLYLSARVDAEEGLRRRAISKVQRLLRDDPSHAGARQLRAELVEVGG